jgi:hypothetical protein
MLTKNLKTAASWLMALYLAVMASGCGLNPVVCLVGEATRCKTCVNSDLTVSNITDENNVLDEVAKDGRSLGYRLVLKNYDCIKLHYRSSVIVEALTGVMRDADITVRKINDKLYVDVAVCGDFGTGNKQYADRLLTEFNEKVLQKAVRLGLTKR